MSCDSAQPACTGCSGEQAPCVCHRPTRRAALLVNLGTPDSPSNRDVRRYLREFLADPFVIKLPGPVSWMTPALSALIATFRGAKSAEAYRAIWWDEGSPLKVITARQTERLGQKLGGDWAVYYAMRYANPSIRDVVASMAKDGITDVVVVPMYPQHAGPTTGTAIEALYRQLRRLGLRFSLSIRNDWYDDRGYIDAQAELLHRYMAERGLGSEDAFLLFSTHSMPASYIKDGDPYEGQVRRSMALVLRRLGWPEHRTSLSFQSKLGPVPWLAPSTEDVLKDLAERGEKNVVVCPISFTADCLETLEEIGMGYAEMFEEQSEGGTLHLVPSLNDDDAFIDALAALVRRGPRRIDHETPLEPLSGSSEHEHLHALIDRLIMVGVSVPGPLEAEDRDGSIDENGLRALGRERHDAIAAVRALAGEDGVDGCVSINTCQRSELYALAAHGVDPRDIVGSVRRHFFRRAEVVEPRRAEPQPAAMVGRDVFRRLLTNALGLSSRLPGEIDAAEQVASSARMATHAGTLSPGLRRVFDVVAADAERIRAATGWERFSRGFGETALHRLGVVSADAGDFVIVGGSTTSKEILRAIAADRSRHVTFFYRGAARKNLVRFVRGVAPHATRRCVHRYDDPSVIDAIASADVVVLGLDSRSPVLTREAIIGARDFGARPLTVVDFNAHGSTDGLEGIEGVTLFGNAAIRRIAAAAGDELMMTDGFQDTVAKVHRAIDGVASNCGECECKPCALPIEERTNSVQLCSVSSTIAGDCQGGRVAS